MAVLPSGCACLYLSLGAFVLGKPEVASVRCNNALVTSASARWVPSTSSFFFNFERMTDKKNSRMDSTIRRLAHSYLRREAIVVGDGYVRPVVDEDGQDRRGVADGGVNHPVAVHVHGLQVGATLYEQAGHYSRPLRARGWGKRPKTKGGIFVTGRVFR